MNIPEHTPKTIEECKDILRNTKDWVILNLHNILPTKNKNYESQWNESRDKRKDNWDSWGDWHDSGDGEEGKWNTLFGYINKP